MIVAPGTLDPPAGRLLTALASRGVPVVHDPAALPAGDAPVTLAISGGQFVFNFVAMVASLGSRPFRVLMLSRLGAHPDARADSLRRLWRLEEHVRGGGAPTLTLRFAPVVGPGTPLWNRLRRKPSLPAGGRMLLNPVHERDAIETLARALDGRARWNGWFEVAGPEVWSLAELRDLAAREGRGPDAGAWEPSLEEMAEHRLAEAEPWLVHFGIDPTAIGAPSGREVA